MADTVPGPSNDVADQRSLPRAATVSSHLAGVLAEAALAAGAGEESVARLLGRDPARPPADNERVPTATVSRLWELLRRLAGPEAGVLAADRAERGRLYVWDYLISNARTLAEGLRDAARFNSAMCDPGVALEVVEDGSLLTARYLDIPHREPIDALSKEFALTVTARRAREGFGDAGVPVRVDFSHAAPADRRYLVRALGTGNLHFDQGRDAITFLASGASGGSNDPVLQQILRSHARHVLASQGPEPSWMDSFRTLLRTTLSDYSNDGMRLDEVAKNLRLSPRTLQRRLAEYGTTWSAELDAVRRDTAVALLSDRSLAVESIAVRLGYRDRRVLARAFRRWTGQSPAEFRRALSN